MAGASMASLPLLLGAHCSSQPACWDDRLKHLAHLPVSSATPKGLELQFAVTAGLIAAGRGRWLADSRNACLSEVQMQARLHA